MLDQETKRRIDTARDILVGKLPNPQAQVEQITIAMIYKFMDDMDKEAMEFGGEATFFTGEFEKYSWTKIFDPKLGGFEMLALYGEAIVKLNQNPNIPQLFRDIFKNAFLPYRDPETLKLFLKIINEFTYDHSEKLGDAFEYLLSVLGSQGDAGQFRTPRHIIDFIVSIVQPKKEETICDPACGTAGFLISAYKHILNENTKKTKGDLLTPDDRKKLIYNFTGYDISAEMVRLSLVNMYLHGFPTPHIYEYDTLTSEERWGDYFDIILANPPFMTPKGGIRPHKKFAMQANRSEVLFVDYIMEHINPTTGRAAVIVPEGIIFQSAGAYKELRKLLVEKNYLYSIVSLPAGIFQPYSGVKTSILLLDKTLAKKTDKILFVKITNDGFSLGAQRKEISQNDLPDAANLIKKYVAAVKNDDLTLIDLNTLPLNALIAEKKLIANGGEYNLSADRYRIIDRNRHQKHEWIEIGEICNLINGRAFKPEEWETDINGGLPIIRIQNLNDKEASFNYYSGDVHDKHLVNTGDLLFSWSGSRGTSFGAHIWNGPKAVLNQHIFKVEFSEKVHKKYLLYALNAAVDEVEDNLHGGVGLVHITKGNLARIKIPVPTLSIQDEFVAKIEQYEKIIAGAKQVIENYKPQIDINSDWEMVELGSVIDELETGVSVNSDNEQVKDGELGILKTSSVTYGVFNPNENKRIIDNEIERAKCNPKKNSILISRMNTENLVGASAFVDIDYPKLFLPDRLWQTVISRSDVNVKYIHSVISSDDYRRKISELCGGTSGSMKNIAKQNFLKLQIPLPAIEQQNKIVEQLDREKTMININQELVQLFETKISAEINKLWEE